MRRIEIDLARTIAIILMVIYHAAFDLSQLYGWQIDVFSGGWLLLARGTLILFLIVSGISSALSLQKKDRVWRKGFRRFVMIGAAALAVTIGTYLFDPTEYVRFGVLHLIAVSGLLLPIFASLGIWNIVIASLIIAVPIMTQSQIMHSQLSILNFVLLPLGFPPEHFASMDYVPLLPWFGVILLSFACAQWFYRKNISHWNASRWIERCTWPGKHALLIYLLHQPILLVLLRFFSSR